MVCRRFGQWGNIICLRVELVLSDICWEWHCAIITHLHSVPILGESIRQLVWNLVLVISTENPWVSNNERTLQFWFLKRSTHKHQTLSCTTWTVFCKKRVAVWEVACQNGCPSINFNTCNLKHPPKHVPPVENSPNAGAREALQNANTHLHTVHISNLHEKGQSCTLKNKHAWIIECILCLYNEWVVVYWFLGSISNSISDWISESTSETLQV